MKKIITNFGYLFRNFPANCFFLIGLLGLYVFIHNIIKYLLINLVYHPDSGLDFAGFTLGLYGFFSFIILIISFLWAFALKNYNIKNIREEKSLLNRFFFLFSFLIIFPIFYFASWFILSALLTSGWERYCLF